MLREEEGEELRLEEKLREGLLKVPTEEWEPDGLLPTFELLLGRFVLLPIRDLSPLLLLAPGVIRVLLSRLPLLRKVLMPWSLVLLRTLPGLVRVVALPLPKRLLLLPFVMPPLPGRPPLLPPLRPLPLPK